MNVRGQADAPMRNHNSHQRTTGTIRYRQREGMRDVGNLPTPVPPRVAKPRMEEGIYFCKVQAAFGGPHGYFPKSEKL